MIEKMQPFVLPENTQNFLDYISKRLGVHTDGTPVYSETRKTDKNSMLQILLTPDSATRDMSTDVQELRERLFVTEDKQTSKIEDLIYWDEGAGRIVIAVQEIKKIGGIFDLEDVHAQDLERTEAEFTDVTGSLDEDTFVFEKNPRPYLKIVEDDT